MTTQSVKTGDAEVLSKEAEQLQEEHRDNIRKLAEALLSKSGTDLKLMSSADIEKLVYEFQVHQIELELQNEELKRAHQELRASHDDFARLYNLAPVAYLTLSEQGIIKKANKVAVQLLSCSIEALVDKKLGKFIHPSDQDSYYFYLHDLVQEKSDQILTLKLAANNGADIDQACHGYGVLGCSQPTCNNTPFTYVELRGAVNGNDQDNIQIHLALQDVSEYKQTQETISCLNEKLEQKILEQTSALIESNLDLTKKVEELNYSRHQLRERETKLNAIFNASIEGIITIDMAGIICSTNTAVSTIFGYSEKELVGCRFNKLLSPAQSKKQGADIKSYLQAKVPSVKGLIREIEGMRKDGSVVPLDISLVEFSIDEANYFTGIVRDVSLRKLQEQQVKEHLEELAHVTRLSLMGEMGSGIAHEVNQPLTAIANYTQACLRFIGVENPDLKQLGEVLFKIHQQALKAGQIVHRMKDFVRPQKMYRADTNINDLVRDAISLCVTDLKENKIELKLELAENIPEVSVDNVQIEQVMLNLIRNGIDALKGMPPSKPRQLSIKTQLINDSAVEIRVKDNGPGIDDAQQPKILTPFFTTKADGMGMGLSISRSLVEVHEGVLRFSSKPEKGTTFYVTLPVKRKSNEQ